MKLGPALVSWFALVTVSIGAVVAAPREPAPVPANQAITQAELGRLLFWDPIMSGNKAVACATCHHPDLAYTDGRDLSIGFGGVGLGPERADVMNGEIPIVRRNSPTLLNAVFNGFEEQRRRRRGAPAPTLDPATQGAGPMFWDSRVDGLEAQALEPLRTFEEMRGTTYPEEVAIDSVVARLREVPEYVTLFREVYGPTTRIEATQIAQAIVAFERTLVAMNSPFDRFNAGDRNAMTAQQIRGMDEFDDAGCDQCHGGPMFSDFDLRVQGIADNPLLSAPDAGAGRFRFKTPSLRNVELTAPYMHNGMLATLEDVLAFYDEGRSRNPNIATNRNGNGDNRPRVDNDLRRVDNMSDQEMEDIIAFLRALTDLDFDRTIPARVPSGLQPGGLIGSSEGRAAPAPARAEPVRTSPARPDPGLVTPERPAPDAPAPRAPNPVASPGGQVALGV